jgi:hypothetical protein
MALKQVVLKDEIWVTKEGKEIPVEKLKVEHMRNILRMIIRSGIIDREDDDLLFCFPSGCDEYGSLE